MAYVIKAVLPSGSSFSGQITYNSPALVIDGLKPYIQAISLDHGNLYVNKYTGFESKKYRLGSTDFSGDIACEVRIMLVGSLPREYQQLLRNLAVACNGAGIHVAFYDDIMSDYTYTGRWVNAGDFVDNSELLCGASIDLSCWSAEAH